MDRKSIPVISQEEAIRLVRSTSKYTHALVVSAIMAELARKLGEDEHQWRLVGLLHDLDYDEVRADMRKHGIVAAGTLKGRLPKNCIYAIKAHDYRAGFKPIRRLDKALVAADSAAILIERSTEKAGEINLERLLKELERASTTQPWHKNNVMKCKDIGLNLSEFLQLCLNSVRKDTTALKSFAKHGRKPTEKKAGTQT
jgi:hypothetical protein